jgi:NET1-associated nuclear protein 1 (U3 small nucleolar RNA-associated protein 17)
MEDQQEFHKSLCAVEACVAYSPDGSILACSTITAEECPLPLVHFISPTTGTITVTKSGIIPADQDVIDFGFLDRYLIVLSLGSIRVWNLVDDNTHYTIALKGHAEDQQQAKLAINPVDDSFAVVSTIPDAEGEGTVPQIEVYHPKFTDTVFEAELESTPVALLSSGAKRGYTILFEDGTIRTLTNAKPASADRRSFIDSAALADESDSPSRQLQRENEASSALARIGVDADDDDAEMADTFAPLAIAAGEDDRPVVRPEQLSSIFDVGQSFAMPPVRDMFQAVVGLYARKPRKALRVEETGV